jgi:hypothetical protein
VSDNPFLLPPDGAKPARPPVVPDATPAARPEHYIAVPASVESATHRIARPSEPGPATVDAPADEVAEETRVAPTTVPTSQAWVLELPDGTRFALAGPLLLGRNPASIPDRPDAELLAVTDPGKTVSKTHALLEPGSDGVRVHELHSTNGVAIDAAGQRVVLAPGGDAVASPGSTILLGSFAIGVEAGR